jgi:hypothetical protein
MIKNLLGKRFGRLIPVKYINNDKHGKARWLCLCDCGKQTIVSSNHLVSGRTKSCGCLNIEKIIQRNKLLKFKHGHCVGNKESKIHHTWRSIRDRCNNPNTRNYKDYGGRGIKVCKRWNDKKDGFRNFLEDVKTIPKGKEIDRINNNKGYNPKNFRIVTSKENCRNKRNNHLIPFNNRNLTMVEWSEITGISREVIGWRLKNGWSVKKALLTPVRKRKK